jgi:fatty-acyl-CoA synthase
MLSDRLLFSNNDTFMNPLPLFHISGAIVCGLAPLLSSSHVVMPAPGGLRDPAVLANFWKLMERVRATMVAAVPTSLAALSAVPVNADLAMLNYVLTGTAPISPETVRRFTNHTGSIFISAME